MRACGWEFIALWTAPEVVALKGMKAMRVIFLLATAMRLVGKAVIKAVASFPRDSPQPAAAQAAEKVTAASARSLSPKLGEKVVSVAEEGVVKVTPVAELASAIQVAE